MLYPNLNVQGFRELENCRNVTIFCDKYKARSFEISLILKTSFFHCWQNSKLNLQIICQQSKLYLQIIFRSAESWVFSFITQLIIMTSLFTFRHRSVQKVNSKYFGYIEKKSPGDRTRARWGDPIFVKYLF